MQEAIEAGRLLKAHGFQFDLVYTSWLSRAVATAWHVLDEMDLLWLPIVKTWYVIVLFSVPFVWALSNRFFLRLRVSVLLLLYDSFLTIYLFALLGD